MSISWLIRVVLSLKTFWWLRKDLETILSHMVKHRQANTKIAALNMKIFVVICAVILCQLKRKLVRKTVLSYQMVTLRSDSYHNSQKMMLSSTSTKEGSGIFPRHLTKEHKPSKFTAFMMRFYQSRYHSLSSQTNYQFQWNAIFTNKSTVSTEQRML